MSKDTIPLRFWLQRISKEFSCSSDSCLVENGGATSFIACFHCTTVLPCLRSWWRPRRTATYLVPHVATRLWLSGAWGSTEVSDAQNAKPKMRWSPTDQRPPTYQRPPTDSVWASNRSIRRWGRNLWGDLAYLQESAEVSSLKPISAAVAVGSAVLGSPHFWLRGGWRISPTPTRRPGPGMTICCTAFPIG